MIGNQIRAMFQPQQQVQGAPVAPQMQLPQMQFPQLIQGQPQGASGGGKGEETIMKLIQMMAGAG